MPIIGEVQNKTGRALEVYLSAGMKVEEKTKGKKGENGNDKWDKIEGKKIKRFNYICEMTQLKKVNRVQRRLSKIFVYH